MAIDRHALLEAVRESLLRLRQSTSSKSASGQGMTQKEFADAAGISRTTIANIETGRQSVSIDLLYRVADAVGVDPRTLLPVADEVRVCDDDDVVLAHPKALPSSWTGAIDDAT